MLSRGPRFRRLVSVGGAIIGFVLGLIAEVPDPVTWLLIGVALTLGGPVLWLAATPREELEREVATALLKRARRRGDPLLAMYGRSTNPEDLPRHLKDHYPAWERTPGVTIALRAAVRNTNER